MHPVKGLLACSPEGKSQLCGPGMIFVNPIRASASISGHRCVCGKTIDPLLLSKLQQSKNSCFMFMFITGCVNHFGLDILFGFLLLCVKQWLKRGFSVLFCFFLPPPRSYF